MKKLSESIVELDCLRILSNVNLKNFSNASVLILGANGFIARYIQSTLSFANINYNLKCRVYSSSYSKPKNFLKSIIKKDKKFKFIKADLNNAVDLQKFSNKKFDFILHCACYGQPSLWMKDQLSTINLNTLVLKFFLDKSKKDNSSILFFSSADVYGHVNTMKKPITENYNFENTSNLNRSAYGGSKRIGESLCRYYRDKFNVKAYSVRPAHTYGPGQGINDKRAISEFIKKGIFNKKIDMLDTGRSIKTFGYISDITEMFFNIIQFGKKTEYNTTGQDYVSILDLATTIASNLDDIKITIPKNNSNLLHIGSDIDQVIISPERYKNEFKKLDFVSFENGIRNVVNWNLGNLI